MTQFHSYPTEIHAHVIQETCIRIIAALCLLTIEQTKNCDTFINGLL